jgi:hypothetical protein
MNTSAISALTQVKSTAQSSVDEFNQLKQKLEQKKSDLSKSDDESVKSTIRKAITELEAKIAKIKPAQSQEGQTRAQSNENTQSRSELAGESKRIGTTNFDETTEFGQRVGYV